MKRIVIKVGSSVLTDRTSIAKERMLNLVSLIVEASALYEKSSIAGFYATSTLKTDFSYNDRSCIKLLNLQAQKPDFYLKAGCLL